jgi:PUA-domain protein
MWTAGANGVVYISAHRRESMDVKSRHHLRSDAIAEIQEALAERLGVEVDADTVENVELTGGEWNVVLVDGDPLVLYVDGENGREPFLTVRGANEYPPEEHVVTVDAGAVQFVSNGADVMRPGIVDADEGITAGDLVVISEESHGKFLAIGRALVEGSEMVGEEGRVVESIHHVGDDLYELAV